MYLLQKIEADLAAEMEALEKLYQDYLPSSGLSGLSFPLFDYSKTVISDIWKRSPRLSRLPRSTPTSPSFTIPRVSLKISGSDSGTFVSNGTLSRSYSKPDLVPFSRRQYLSKSFSIFVLSFVYYFILFGEVLHVHVHLRNVHLRGNSSSCLLAIAKEHYSNLCKF